MCSVPLLELLGIHIFSGFLPANPLALLLPLIVSAVLASLCMVCQARASFTLLVLVCVSCIGGLFLACTVRNGSLCCGTPSERITHVEGVLRFDTSLSDRGNTVFQVQLDSVGDRWGNRFSAKGNLMLLSHETQGILEAGTRIGADGHIWSPEKDLNLFYVDSVTAIEARRCSASLRLRILAWAQQRLDLLGEPIAGALLLGTASAEGRVKGLAVQAGVAHVLALSGMHLQFFVLLIMPILTLMFGAAKGRMVAYPFALGYVMLVGFKPSLTRALLMLSLGPWKRRFGMITILWISYVVQTICFPKTIDSEGALLSYASLAAILLLAPSLSALFHPYLTRMLASALATSVAASLGTGWLSILLFGAWYPVGIIVSIIVVPLVTLLFIMLVLYLITGNALAANAVRLLSDWFTKAVMVASEWSAGHHWTSTLRFWACSVAAMLTVAVIVGYACRTKRKRNGQTYDVGFSLRFSKRHQ